MASILKTVIEVLSYSLASVVLRLDNIIQRINYYPVDKCCPAKLR